MSSAENDATQTLSWRRHDAATLESCSSHAGCNKIITRLHAGPLQNSSRHSAESAERLAVEALCQPTTSVQFSIVTEAQ